jgi:hypothetical protein
VFYCVLHNMRVYNWNLGFRGVGLTDIVIPVYEGLGFWGVLYVVIVFWTSDCVEVMT